MTEADLAADRVITEGLRAERPDDPILSEESHWTAGADPLARATGIWCVDPLDGTEAFIDPIRRGYAVQIARLERASEGGLWRPVVGVVYEPATDELFAAAPDVGVIFERGGVRTALAQPTGLRRVVTSSRAPLRLRQALFARGYADAGTLRSVGVKVGHLLKGHAEIYPGPPALAYWDLAAPQAILEAAGGTVSDAAGAPPSYHFERGLTAPTMGGPTLMTYGVDHAQVLADLQAIGRELEERARPA